MFTTANTQSRPISPDAWGGAGRYANRQPTDGGQPQQPTAPNPTAPGQPATGSAPEFDRYGLPVRRHANPGGTAETAYEDYFNPAAERGRDLLFHRYGFGAPDVSGVAYHTPTMRNALRGIRDIAGENLSYTMGMDGANYLSDLMGNNGLASGTGRGLTALDGIATGQNRVTTGSQYRDVQRDPISHQQRSASGTFNDIRRGGADISSTVGQQYARDGSNALMDQARAEFRRAAAGKQNVGTGRMESVYRGAQGPSFAERNITDIASGAARNDYMESILDQVANRAKAAASAAGRGYGSGYEAGQTTEAMARVMFDQHNRDIANRLAATGQLDDQRLQGLGLQRGLASDITGIQSQNTDRRVQAARDMQGLGQAEAANQLAGEAQAANIQAGNRTARMQGAQSQANIGQQGIANRLSALQGLTGVQGTNIANQGNAAQAALQARDTGVQQALRSAALMPELLGSRYADASRRVGAADSGQQRQDLRQAEARADAYADQQAPWDQLAAYFAAQNGSSLPGSALGFSGAQLSDATARAQLSASKPNSLAQTLGLVGAGVGAANQAGLFESLPGAVGGGVSAIGSAIGSIFG